MSRERILVCISIFFLLFGLGMPFLVRKWYMNYDDYNGIMNLGPIGDFLAGTTVTFLNTGSILLLLATILMQRKELKISQQGIDELIKQTKSVKEQAEETRKETQITNYTMKRQQFDSTFFNMINLHNSIVSEIEYNHKASRIALSLLWNSFIINLRTKLRLLHEEGIAKINGQNIEFYDFARIYSNKKVVSEVFEEFFEMNSPKLGHYYRNMYRIIKFIEESSLKEEEKNNYRGIFRAQLSIGELNLLFYNVNFSKHGREFFMLLKGKRFFQDHINSLLQDNTSLVSTLNREAYNDMDT